MTGFAGLFGMGASGGKLATALAWRVFSSRSITFTKAGRVRVRAMGGGGGGGDTTGNRACSGANSPPWGVKTFSVMPGDVLTISIGAGGAVNAAGGATIIYLNGVEIMRCNGGERGFFTASTGVTVEPVAPAATVTGADYWGKGLRGGYAIRVSGAGAIQAGGAAPDVLDSGLGNGGSASGGGTLNASGGAVGTNGNDSTSGSADGATASTFADVSAWGFVQRHGAVGGTSAVPIGGFLCSSLGSTSRKGGNFAGNGGGGGEPGDPGYAFVEYQMEA